MNSASAILRQLDTQFRIQGIKLLIKEKPDRVVIDETNVTSLSNYISPKLFLQAGQQSSSGLEDETFCLQIAK